MAAPGLLSPIGGRTTESLAPSFRWLYVGGATRYELEWSIDTHFSKSHTGTIISSQTAAELDEAHALKAGETYAWRVRGGNDGGWGPWSGPESFRSPEK